MTDYFVGFPIAGWTRHFLITYTNEGDADQVGRANAVLASCEADLTALSDWFNCNYDLSPYSIWVNIGLGVENGGASNTGYDSDKSATVEIDGTYRAAVPNVNAIRDEYARMLFVAELSEILMDFSGYGWDRGNSAGEALSRVLAALLHPAGYYRPNVGGPYVNSWLRAPAPRPDWISSSEGSDTNIVSYGCGILFIYYLAAQRGFSYKKIITAGGSSLAETFARLTGLPASDAFQEFSDQLVRHLPVGLTRSVPRDNVFPLREDPTISISFGENTLARQTDPFERQVLLKLGPRCEERIYTYNGVDVTSQVTMQAYSHGLAFPTFFWWVNGVALSVHNRLARAVLPVTVTDTTPRKDDLAEVVNLPVDYLITDAANGSLVQMTNKSFPGNIGQITVVVQAAESLVGIPPYATLTEDWDFTTRSYDMHYPYDQDLYDCNWHPTREVLVAKDALLGQVFLLKNRPDPPPDQLLQLAKAGVRYQAALEALTNGVMGLRSAVSQVVDQQMDALPTPVSVEMVSPQGGQPVRLSLDTFVPDAERLSGPIDQPDHPPVDDEGRTTVGTPGPG